MRSDKYVPIFPLLYEWIALQCTVNKEVFPCENYPLTEQCIFLLSPYYF